MGRWVIRTVRLLLLLALLFMGLLALLRVPWAVRFWRRGHVLAWVYVFLVLVLAAIEAWRLWG